MRSSTSLHPVTIHEPTVLLPVKEYQLLLLEAGYLPSPKLTRAIARARARFRQGRTIPWEQLKRALK
jgi:PHD/YefM family antitoxin component YafN of YafNO toxin-antitoxin module